MATELGPREGTYVFLSIFGLPILAGALITRFEKRPPKPYVYAVLVAALSYVFYDAYSKGAIRAVAQEDMVLAGAGLAILAVIEGILRLLFTIPDETRYHIIHTIANVVGVVTTWEYVMTVIVNPSIALGGPVNAGLGIGHALIVVLHIHHCIFYNPTKADLVHHIVSAFIVGGSTYIFHVQRMAPVSNFFICGLPGVFDHIWQILAHYGWMERMTYKEFNLWNQLGFRWPGYFLVLYVLSMSSLHTNFQFLPALLVALITFLNGGNSIYYAQRVVGNTYMSRLRAKTAAEEKKSK